MQKDPYFKWENSEILEKIRKNKKPSSASRKKEDGANNSSSISLVNSDQAKEAYKEKVK